MQLDYSAVTEVPGNRITREALRMLRSRYAFAGKFCEGKEVLEVACGTGQGLGLLAKRARRVVGGDYTSSLLDVAQQHYAGRIPLVRLDAQALPFADGSFDVVLLFEAIYYLEAPECFLCESQRILRPGGTLLICSANSECPGFNPSPFSTHYFRALELRRILSNSGFDVEIYGAFPALAVNRKQKATLLVRRFAAKWNLFPKTMKGKEFLKRLFYGKLVPVGPEIEEPLANPTQLFPLSMEGEAKQYKVFYEVATLGVGVPVVR